MTRLKTLHLNYLLGMTYDHAEKKEGKYPRRIHAPISERMWRYLQDNHINMASLTRSALRDRIGEEALAEYEPDEEATTDATTPVEQADE